MFVLAADIPISIWSDIEHFIPNPSGRPCLFFIANLGDLINFLFLVGLFFYFIFVRAEYFRNQEEAVWITISKIQDTDFVFRNFYN